MTVLFKRTNLRIAGQLLAKAVSGDLSRVDRKDAGAALVLNVSSARAHFRAGPPITTLNKTSIKPAVYGERFVKRRGLFLLAVAPRHGVVSGCVSRQDHDRSAVH